MKRLLLFFLLLLSCGGTETEHRTAVEHGRDLFASKSTSNSQLNAFSCATCHFADVQDARILPGHPLGGAVDRPTFWGGERRDLLEAINDCRYLFMNATNPWTADDPDAQAMYAYLSSLPKTQPTALPLTVVPIAADLPPGDESRGALVYDRSCRSCHGAAHTADGRLRQGITLLPEEEADSLTKLFGFTRDQVRVTFIEKARHGAFLGVYGNMPLYSTEAMSDADLAAVMAYLGLY